MCVLLLSGVQASLSPSVRPTGPLTSQRDLSSQCGTQDWGVQHVARTTPLPERIFAHVISLLLCVFSSLCSRVRVFATPWTVAYQDPESIGFSRQEYWSGLQFPSPGDLPNPGIKPGPPAL